MLREDVIPLAPKRDDGSFSLLDGDLVPPEPWEELWKDMPVFEMGDAEAIQKIVVHFRSREDVQEFSELLGEKISTNTIGSRITDRTDSMWFKKDKDYVAPKELLYIGDNSDPRYPVYIISKGRWDTPLTARALEAINVPYRIVVEPAEAERYAAVLGEASLLVAPENFSERGQGSIPVRNFVWEHALAARASRHWILDDNIRGFLRINRNRRIPVNTNAIFRAVEDFTDRYKNIALSGFNYMYLAKPVGGIVAPILLNTRVYSMILVNSSLPHRWRGRYNEDTDLSLRVLKDGLCTVLFHAFVGDKITTMAMKGGNTDTIYNTGDRRRAFAESLVEQHPDVARVVWRYERWHHEVDYRPFAKNKLIPREGWTPPDDPEYGMRLVRTKPRASRYPRAGEKIEEAVPNQLVGFDDPPPTTSAPTFPAPSPPLPADLAAVEAAVAWYSAPGDVVVDPGDDPGRRLVAERLGRRYAAGGAGALLLWVPGAPSDDYAAFLGEYAARVRAAVAALGRGRAAALVSDHRDPASGQLVGFVWHTVAAFQEAGARLADEVVLAPAVPAALGEDGRLARRAASLIAFEVG